VFTLLVCSRIRTILFCKNRKLSEIFTNQVYELLEDSGSFTEAPSSIVKCYRGGYTADLRRKIESDLFSGTLQGVIATNALELGVDIGSLDAVVHVGFPSRFLFFSFLFFSFLFFSFLFFSFLFFSFLCLCLFLFLFNFFCSYFFLSFPLHAFSPFETSCLPFSKLKMAQHIIFLATSWKSWKEKKGIFICGCSWDRPS